jgi:DNA-binding response OmpR family regulator
MAKTRILVVEDDPSVVIFIVDQLEYLGYKVDIARNGIEGLEQVHKVKPDLIVLDVMMPEMDGYEVCQRLKSSPETEQIPILMLTAKGQAEDKVRGFDKGADDYLPKPYDKSELEARVKALLKRSSSPPYSVVQDHCTLSFLCEPGQRINLRIAGTVTLATTTKGLLDIDADEYNRVGDNVPCLDWRFNSKREGKQLYRLVFADHPEVLSGYNHVLGDARDEERLHLCFESSRDLLRVPLEFLFEGIHGDGDYLVLKHPLRRCITGIHTKRIPPSPTFFNDLWAKRKRLNVLLIASNTLPPIPGVDQEIEALDRSLKGLFEQRRISAHVKTIPTKEATYETVREELQACRYHIVHYAGHGAHDRQSAEKSCLFFWEKPNRQGEVKRMPVSELQLLLRGADLRFAYLSCCLGATTGAPAQLLDDDFLGIADGIVHAGVPSVLGYRWSVSDVGAPTMAEAFYRSLAKQGQLDTALLHARCEVAGGDRDDITWLSPILILQA